MDDDIDSNYEWFVQHYTSCGPLEVTLLFFKFFTLCE